MKGGFAKLLKYARAKAFVGRKSLFDPRFYLDSNPDVAASGIDPYRHFLKHGIEEKRSPNLFFDVEYYSNQSNGYSAGDPTSHYLHHGAALGLNPHPQFNTRWYLENYKDVAASGMNPLLHYLRHGQKENRQTAPKYMKVFGTIMPEALGLKMSQHMVSVTFSTTSSRRLSSARYFPKVMIYFGITGAEGTSLLLAGKTVSKSRGVKTQVLFNIGLRGNSGGVCIVFHGCFVSYLPPSEWELSFEEAHLFSTENGGLTFVSGLPACNIRIA